MKNKRRRSFSQTNLIAENQVDLSIKKPKVTNFKMLSYDDYKSLKEFDYNLIQLKNIARFHKIKVSGTKQQLINRLYNFLFESSMATKIQKKFRKRIVKIWKILKGPGLIKRNKSTNECDFYTLEKIKDIHISQVISFKENNLIFTFDICSLYNLLKLSQNNNDDVKNPFTQNLLPSNILFRIKRIIQLQKCLYLHTNLVTENNDTENNDIFSDESINHKIVDIFSKIDMLGNYTDISWFTSLNYHRLIRYVRELYDIWNYRAQLSNEIKRSICHPTGNPFTIHYNTLIENDNINYIKYKILEIMNNLISKGTTQENKSLGAFYVLAALTLVNNDAATSLPWLYESVSHLHHY